MSPFADVRIRLRCEAKEPRSFKVGTRVVHSVETGEGSYDMLEPVYETVQPGAEYDLPIAQALPLLEMYGKNCTAALGFNATKKLIERRPWVEVKQVSEAGGLASKRVA